MIEVLFMSIFLHILMHIFTYNVLEFVQENKLHHPHPPSGVIKLFLNI